MKKGIDKSFFKSWSRESAYVLGFFAADGNMVVNERGGKYLSFYSCDRDILLKMQKVMGSTHKLSKRGGVNGGLCRFQIGSIEMYDDLIKLGFRPNKMKRIRMPEVPKKFFADFIRGYFDGDGNVWSGFINKSRMNPTHVLQASFTSGCVPFLQELSKTLRQEKLAGGFLI